MSIYTAYFDESGSPDEGKALVVAGYVASDEQWLVFDHEWKEALAAEGIDRFHMRDFAHSKREFENWKGDEERRSRFIQRLIGIIRERLRCSIATAVILEDYRAINQKYMLDEFLGPPYAICGLTCVKNTLRWADQRGYIDPVRYVFEDGAKDKNKFKRIMGRFQLRDPIFGTKDDHLAFQAADFVAWESLKNYTQHESQTFRRFRKSFAALYSMPTVWVVFPGVTLEQTCQNMGIPMRDLP